MSLSFEVKTVTTQRATMRIMVRTMKKIFLLYLHFWCPMVSAKNHAEFFPLEAETEPLFCFRQWLKPDWLRAADRQPQWFYHCGFFALLNMKKKTARVLKSLQKNMFSKKYPLPDPCKIKIALLHIIKYNTFHFSSQDVFPAPGIWNFKKKSVNAKNHHKPWKKYYFRNKKLDKFENVVYS